jgi:hypothetical protein
MTTMTAHPDWRAEALTTLEGMTPANMRAALAALRAFRAGHEDDLKALMAAGDAAALKTWLVDHGYLTAADGQ